MLRLLAAILTLVAPQSALAQTAPPKPASTGPAAPFDTAAIERLTGAKGTLAEKEGVFKVSVPRKDLSVSVAGAKITPPLGLTSWAAFRHVPQGTVVMGDLVLTEAQVNPVMSAALDSGLDVTALHNHFLWDTPRVMFMHIHGHGAEATLAGAVGKVFAKMQETAAAGPPPAVPIDPAQSTLDPKKIDAVLGPLGATGGPMADGVYKLTFGRATRMHDADMGNAMGVNTWAAFAGSDDRALVDGDFAMLEGELQGVLRALRAAGINVVAIHQHMTGEQPRVVFLHYWGVGPTSELANGLKTALARTATAGKM
jgi:Domain of Unknown Function (DUF1259)